MLPFFLAGFAPLRLATGAATVALVFAQRAFCAAAILARPAADMVRLALGRPGEFAGLTATALPDRSPPEKRAEFALQNFDLLTQLQGLPKLRGGEFVKGSHEW